MVRWSSFGGTSLSGFILAQSGPICAGAAAGDRALPGVSLIVFGPASPADKRSPWLIRAKNRLTPRHRSGRKRGHVCGDFSRVGEPDPVPVGGQMLQRPA